jgi:zinc protease
MGQRRMRRAWIGWAGAAVVVALGAATTGARTAAASVGSAPARTTAPRLNFAVSALPNGLKLVTLEDHHAPVVTLQIWYHVGSKDEPKGKFGFAHLFEHLMFKGSKHVPSEGHAHYVEQIGGDYNANTYFDRTLFFETVPNNALDRVLFLEADRMASLVLDEANFHSERHVVEEELRMDVLNAPYGHLEDETLGLVFPPGYPYAHSTIGFIPDLESASLADVKAFHDTYYKPDNATLVLVGDFSTLDAIARIRKYFGAIPPRGRPFPRIPFATNLPSVPHRVSMADPLAPLALVTLNYRMPPAADPDAPAFDVLTSILGHGHSSRLYRSLVQEKQISTDPGADTTDLTHAGVFSVNADVLPGKDPVVVEKALRGEIDRLRSAPVSAEELTKAKNQALTGLVFGSVSTAQTAELLGQADLDFGSPEAANRTFALISGVTAADVERVARRYLTPTREEEITITPPAAPAAAPEKAGGKSTK